jgi:proteic killer suppression protein
MKIIKTFRGKAAAMVFVGEVPKGFPPQIARVARRKLSALDVAKRLDDLRQPPGHNLESLAGDRAGQHSVRINLQWRLCFIWRGGDAYEVEPALGPGPRDCGLPPGDCRDERNHSP